MNFASDFEAKATELGELRLQALKRGDFETAEKLWGEMVLFCELQLLAAGEDMEGVRG